MVFLQTIVLLLALLEIGVFAFRLPYSTTRRMWQRQIQHLAPQQLGEFEPINTSNEDRALRRVWLYDYVSASDSSTVTYHEIWDHQKSLVNHQLSRIGKGPKEPPLYDQFIPVDLVKDSQTTIGCDSIIMVEHDPVYTLGTASDASFIKGYHASDENREEVTISDDGQNPIPIVRIERGGEVTYHGPGQLVVYPIIDLRGYNQDIHWYMRALEEVIILALDKAGIKGATREDNLTGVWVSGKKIAALGIKARRWVTMHGLAINVDLKSLQNFEGIVPCGIEGREVTCINTEFQDDSAGFTIRDFAVHVQEALEEVFGISLVPAPLNDKV
ncbi:hypothetical protein ACHAWO_013186 [Cyclotella atomus]|uniref:lipoyl(octanoyl) transferase n=1 Tax=Cyclotella atomus TaxID=382360 RepID=A0ABD3NE37_9STRA